MTMLFRSKSIRVGRAAKSMLISSPPTPSLYLSQEEDENEEEEEEEEEDEDEEDDVCFDANRVRTPFIGSEGRIQHQHNRQQGQGNQFQILDSVLVALRKSLVTCSVEAEDVSSMDIGWPTDVRHISHVTFDRFNGFLGLPVELEPEVPPKVPSASASVFGVSAKSMQCSYDERGNSVPTILLMMQKRLYMEGGLQAEGIFRITAENSQEEFVRNQLNRGIVPHGMDIHCLAGLIKAWFRERPTGVLDSLNAEQVMHCNTEEECTQLVKFLPPTEAALLDWAINLMADVVQQESHNKMNARNIAMVFAPNMTQMANPLTALLHAVQVMNLLKTLIIRTLRERQQSIGRTRSLQICTEDTEDKGHSHSPKSSRVLSCGQTQAFDAAAPRNLWRCTTLDRLECDGKEKIWSCKNAIKSPLGKSSPETCRRGSSEKGCIDEYNYREVEGGIFDRLSLKKGVKKLCRHPVFQLSKPAKKNGSIAIVNSRGGDHGEAWA